MSSVIIKGNSGTINQSYYLLYKGINNTQGVIESLTKSKTYYVRIRTYKTVGSAKYWSVWSAAKSVKIAK